jgi:hypothetical protein
MLNLAFQKGESLEIFSCEHHRIFQEVWLGKIINGRFIAWAAIYSEGKWGRLMD